MNYPAEQLDPNYDDGTILNNVADLEAAVVGHRIVKTYKGTVDVDDGWRNSTGLIIELDNGTKVELADSNDCCAYTELDAFLLHPEMVDHIITGVATTDGATTWHIYADMGDVLELSVSWSCGNPFYYGYGFYINVKEVAK